MRTHDFFVYFQKINRDNDIIFDDSPLDASDGQRFLHKRSIDDLSNDNEHWLWSRVDRIKRSVHSAWNGENDESEANSRVKRDFWDLFKTDTETTTTPKPDHFNIPDVFDTTQKTIDREQADHTDRNDIDEEDDGNENGSGGNNIDDSLSTSTMKLYQFCKQDSFLNLIRLT